MLPGSPHVAPAGVEWAFFIGLAKTVPFELGE